MQAVLQNFEKLATDEIAAVAVQLHLAVTQLSKSTTKTGSVGNQFRTLATSTYGGSQGFGNSSSNRTHMVKQAVSTWKVISWCHIRQTIVSSVAIKRSENCSDSSLQWAVTPAVVSFFSGLEASGNPRLPSSTLIDTALNTLLYSG